MHGNSVDNKRVGCRAGQWFWFELTIQTAGRFVLGVIVPIPQRARNIKCKYDNFQTSKQQKYGGSYVDYGFIR